MCSQSCNITVGPLFYNLVGLMVDQFNGFGLKEKHQGHFLWCVPRFFHVQPFCIELPIVVATDKWSQTERRGNLRSCNQVSGHIGNLELPIISKTLPKFNAKKLISNEVCF